MHLSSLLIEDMNQSEKKEPVEMGGEKKQEMCDMILILDWMGECEVEGPDIRNCLKQRRHLLGQQEETHVVTGMCIFQCVGRKLR